MTNLTYNYTLKFSFWLFSPVLIFGGLAVYSLINEVGFSYRGRISFPYPYSYYIPGIIAVVFAVYFVNELLKWHRAKQNTEPIKLGDTSMSFSEGSSMIVRVNYKEVNELWVKDDDDESVILYTDNNKNRYEFISDNFDSDSKYIEFRTFLEKACTQITNRK